MKKTPTGKMLKRGRKREKRKSHQHGTESSCIKKTCEAWWSRQYIKFSFRFPLIFIWLGKNDGNVGKRITT